MNCRECFLWKQKKVRTPWIMLLCVAIFCLLSVSKDAIAQVGSVWQPTVRRVNVRDLTKPAPAGAVITRGRYGSGAIPPILAIHQAFLDKDKINVDYDDYGTFGRFCDRDGPFHILIQDEDLTPHHNQCWSRRFPADTPQPEVFVVGRIRVVFVVHRHNHVQTLTCMNLGHALCENGKNYTWNTLDQVGGTSKIQVFGVLGNKWVRKLIEKHCMLRCRNTENPGVKQTILLPFRDDIVDCLDAAEVIDKVRDHRHAIGFFVTTEPLTKRDLYGVRVVAVTDNENMAPVTPNVDSTWDPNDSNNTYPLSAPLTLYLHPKAPPAAREFCKFAAGAEGPKILKKFDIWPEYELKQKRGEKRLIKAKVDRGKKITVCDLTNHNDLLKDLATEFIKAKTAVQLEFVDSGKRRKSFYSGLDHVDHDILEQFNEGSIELLLTDTPLKTDNQSQATLKSKNKTSSETFSAPRSVVIGHLAAGIVVHPENPLKSLTLDEVKAIFSGMVKKWPAVRGAAPPIHVFGLKRNKPVAQLLKEKLFKGEKRKLLKYKAQPNNEKVISAVASDPAAIGFVDLSQLSPEEKSVRLVPVLPPGQSLVKQKTTKNTKKTNEKRDVPPPLSRTLTLYISPKASLMAMDFAKFLTPEHSKAILTQHHLQPPLPVDKQPD